MIARVEVESFIEDAVDEALSSSSASTHREVLINTFVQALEKDASWVELYGVTGELNVPALPDSEGDAAQLAASASEVSANQDVYSSILLTPLF